MARRPLRSGILAGALSLALAASVMTGCSDDDDGGGAAVDTAGIVSDEACTPGEGVAVELSTDDVGSDEMPEIKEVPEPDGKTRSGAEADTLVDHQNFAGGDPNHIDPGSADTLQGAQVPVLLYDGLTDTSYEGEVIPKVAEKWEANDDASEFVFTLKDGQTFSDGSPVTPTSFKKAWERALDPDFASAVAYHILPVKGAAEVNDGSATELEGVVADDAANTLTVTLNEPFADFPAVVSHPVFSPLPEAAFSGDAADWEQGVMIGNGPYKMAEAWKHNASIKLVKNDAYTAGEPAKTTNLHFIISKDVDAAYNAFRAGKADTALIPPSNFAAATGEYKAITDPYLAVYKFEIGQDNPCLGGPNNLKLRQALSLSIDRDRINKQVYDDARVTASGLTPPGVEGFKSGLCDTCTRDIDKAKQLIKEWQDEGGHLNGPIKIGTNTGSGHEPVVSIIVENFKELGIPAELNGLNPDTWTDDLRKEGGCQFCRAGWVWDYPVYDNVLSAQYLSSGIDSDNWARFDSEDYDAAIAKARATTDDAERAKIYRQAEKMLLDNQVTVPLNWYRGQVVIDNRVEGLRMSPLSFLSYEEATVG